MGYQLSAISYQLSAISYQLSAISYQLSAISYQLSAISYHSHTLPALEQRVRGIIERGDKGICAILGGHWR
jgi:hypothetical protein